MLGVTLTKKAMYISNYGGVSQLNRGGTLLTPLCKQGTPFPQFGASHLGRCLSHFVIMPPVAVLLLDGGLGTTLQDNYNAIVDGAACPLWSSHLLISDPILLCKAQTAFADAGADVLLTATYQASLEGLSRTKPEPASDRSLGREHAEQYMRSAVAIARKAFAASNRQTAGHIALSLGAYGATMVPSQEYSGSYDAAHSTAAQLGSWHRERLGIYRSDADTWKSLSYVAFETIPRVDEIAGVREAMHAINSDDSGTTPRPFWISCVFPDAEMRLADGTTVDMVVDAMLGAQEGADTPYAIGLNCTKVSKVPALLALFEASVTNLVQTGEVAAWPALVLYPDGTNGEVYNTITHEWDRKDDRCSGEVG